MLYEFALDPSVLNNWDTVRYFIDNFGVPKGRLISQYPRKWKRMVIETCSSRQGLKEYAKIVEILSPHNTIDSKFIRSGREYDSNFDWLPNATQQNNKLPFHAIIADKNPQNVPNILIAFDISDGTPLWNIKNEECVPRDAKNLRKYIEPLLKISSEIIFVDPYFNPYEQRFRNTLSEFISSTDENNKLKRIEFHLGNTLGQKFFNDGCQKHIPVMLTRNRTITFVRWDRLGSGDSLHPRYILTDRGGIRIERGLDEGQAKGETTDVSLLDSSLYSRRWKDYQRDTSPFKFVDELIIAGTL
jgi:hypothetical protein